MRTKHENNSAFKVKKVNKETVSQKVINEIKMLIESGQVSHGTKLPNERKFAEMLGVSRPSLREALKVLGVLGIIENRHGTGNFLNMDFRDWPMEPFSLFFSIKKGALLDIFEARQGLEEHAVSLAAERRTEEDLANIGLTVEKMKQNMDDPDAFFKCDMAFHREITKATHNPVLIDILGKIYKLLVETRYEVYRVSSHYEVSNSNDLTIHEELFKHISDGDAAAAKSNIAKHLKAVKERLHRAAL